jgi:uncharacterized protein YheU (UPF0270 family)
MEMQLSDRVADATGQATTGPLVVVWKVIQDAIS